MNRYESYKDSGIEWIGDIPEEWFVSRSGKFFTERSEKVDDVTYLPLSVTMSGIVDQLSHVAKTNDGENRKLVKKDDFVINSRSDRKGSSGIAPRNGSVSLINIVLEPTGITSQFILHLFKSYYFKEEFFRNGKGIHWDLWTTRWEQFKNINIPVPSIQEQKLIARYLDKKTAQIDLLIEKIEKKIALLQEKRTALINQCVTKGLDPNVEMQDSGIEWIGKIPKHWGVKKLKRLVSDKGLIRGPFGGSLKVETFVSKGYKVYEQKNAIYSNFNLGSSFIDKNKFLELSRFKIQANDILMSCSGTIGKTVLVPENIAKGIINQALLIIRLQDIGIITPSYIQTVFSSSFFQEQVIDNSQGGAMKNLVGIDIFRNVKIPIPPYKEQSYILESLNKKTNTISRAIEKEKKRVKIFKEYRQALISSVVTGKVRVTEAML